MYFLPMTLFTDRNVLTSRCIAHTDYFYALDVIHLIIVVTRLFGRYYPIPKTARVRQHTMVTFVKLVTTKMCMDVLEL